MHLNICSRGKRQTEFSERKNGGEIRVKNIGVGCSLEE